MASASVTLGINTAPFEAGLKRAEAQSRNFESKITSFFKRDPGKRAETALSGFAADLASGNVQGAITGLSTRISGFGLAAGIAIGAAAEVFISFRAQALEADAAVRKVAETMGTFSDKGRSVEALSAHFKTLSASVGEALAKRSTVGNKFARLLEDLQPLPTKNRRASRQDATIRAALDEEIQTLRQRSEAEANLVGIRETGMHTSERQAALDKIALDASEKRGQVEDEQRQALVDVAKLAEKNLLRGKKASELYAAINKDAEARKESVTRGEELSAELAKRTFEAKQKEANMEERILNLIGNGKTLEENRLTILRERLSLNKQLETLEGGTPEGAQRARIRTRASENELFNEEFRQRFNPPEGGAIWQTPEMREASERAKFERDKSKYGQKSRHLDISGEEIDPAGRSTLEQTSARVPGAYNGPQDRDFSRTGQPYATPTFQSQLGNLDRRMAGPTHMAPLGHMDRFGKKQDDPVEEAPSANKDGPVVGAIDSLEKTVVRLWGP